MKSNIPYEETFFHGHSIGFLKNSRVDNLILIKDEATSLTK